VHLIEESVAAAIGAGLAIAEPVGRMVVDVGGGTSEVAIISLGGIVVSRSLRVGGYDLDDAIATHIRSRYRMAIGTQSAEAIKLAVGSAMALEEELLTTVRGRDLTSGLPRELELSSEEVRGALEPQVAEIVGAVHGTLEASPPELAADLAREGILLAGGGALLRRFDDRITRDTGIEVRIAAEPLTCVAIGAGQTLEELDALARVPRR
jgi:rod shape-determining protein MreB